MRTVDRLPRGPAAVPLTGSQYQIAAGQYRATVTELGAGRCGLLPFAAAPDPEVRIWACACKEGGKSRTLRRSARPRRPQRTVILPYLLTRLMCPEPLALTLKGQDRRIASRLRRRTQFKRWPAGWS